MGSKNRLAKQLLPIILKDRKPDQLYVEPFVGGCNIIDKVTGRRWANDSNHYLVELFKALNAGWIPPENVSPELYKTVKDNKEGHEPALVAFVGFLCSFGGKWFGGYAKNTVGRNYALEGGRSLLKQIGSLKDVSFTCLSYQEMVFDELSVIYCDPPYQNTVKYKDNFDHDLFWQWVRDKTKEGHTVFVSEYKAPDDFECLLEIETFTCMNKNQRSPRIERLFRMPL